MHILFFLPNLAFYKDRVHLLMEISNGLRCLTLLVGRKDMELDLENYKHLRVINLNFHSQQWLFNILKASRVAKRLIIQENINIVHDTFGYLLPLFRQKKPYSSLIYLSSLFILSKWRICHIFQKYSLWKMLSSKQTALTLLNSWIETKICMYADQVIMQAPGLIDRLLETSAIPRSKVQVINNNVDIDFWCPSSEHARSNGRDNYGLLFVGGIHFSKGIFSLIETLYVLHGMDPKWHLKIVGNWSSFDKERVLKLIHSYDLDNVIEFIPAKLRAEELRHLYRNSYLFLYQTINDGSPRVILEALACGLPVVASHYPGIDNIDPKGDFICFTQFGDVEAIVKHILFLKSNGDDWQRRASLSRLAIEKYFSTKAVAKQYISLYSKLLKNTKSNKTTQLNCLLNKSVHP